MTCPHWFWMAHWDWRSSLTMGRTAARKVVAHPVNKEGKRLDMNIFVDT